MERVDFGRSPKIKYPVSRHETDLERGPGIVVVVSIDDEDVWHERLEPGDCGWLVERRGGMVDVGTDKAEEIVRARVRDMVRGKTVAQLIAQREELVAQQAAMCTRASPEEMDRMAWEERLLLRVEELMIVTKEVQDEA